MSDRRDFLKSASLLGISSLPGFSTSLAPQPIADTPHQDSLHPVKASPAPLEPGDIVLENAEMQLVVSSAGWARSLVHKPTGQECLSPSPEDPLFLLTQYRPYDNELQLALPGRNTTFPSTHVTRKGDHLIVEFHSLGYEADIQLALTDAYIAFYLKSLTYNGYTTMRPKKPTQIDETVFLQLPICNRKNLGEQLNVMWDDNVAVNLLATSLATKIDAKSRRGYHLFQAGTIRDVQSLEAGAALIVTATPHLLDRIGKVEEDFKLPRGAESRRRPEYKYSYFQAIEITPKDVDRQIKYAKMAGLRTMNIYCLAFAKSIGKFPWRPEYPRGMEDLKEVVGKVSSAGIIPGLHILYTMATETDPMVTPVPDRRLNMIRTFTLSQSVTPQTTTIPVDENPRLCTTEDGLRLLKIQNELVSYARFTAEPPFQFEGCERGELGTVAEAHAASTRVGLLDTYGGGRPSWIFARFTQNTSLQNEVAAKIEQFYDEAGFRFIYFDGAEQVPGPFWYTIARAQQCILDPLKTQPLFSEGSCKAHFSWHIVSRGNAFDVSKPEEIKAATRAYPAEEIQRVSKDFTSINFGWIGYWAPSDETIGTQPDMLEYVTSRASAWDCPISISRGSKDLLSALDEHPRTPDNMEVIRRWEDVRAQSWLSPSQKLTLQNLKQEHMLLIDEHRKFVLVPYEQIDGLAAPTHALRAFLFKRNGNPWVAYWHPSGQASLNLAVPARQIRLMRELGTSIPIEGTGRSVSFPLGERRYIEFLNLSRERVIAALRSAKVTAT
jgi:hypothetical protein